MKRLINKTIFICDTDEVNKAKTFIRVMKVTESAYIAEVIDNKQSVYRSLGLTELNAVQNLYRSLAMAELQWRNASISDVGITLTDWQSKPIRSTERSSIAAITLQNKNMKELRKFMKLFYVK
jgi:hypothetical protein